MAGPVAAPAAAPAAAGAARGGGGFNIMGMLARVAFMYFVMQFFSGKKAPLSQDRNNYVFPKFEPPHVLDFYMFISEQPSIRHYKMEELVWSETGITLGDKFSRQFDYTYELSQNVQNNGSLYVHAVFAKAGLPIHPFDEGYDESFVFSAVGRLNRYLPQRRNGTGVNLLAGEVLSEETKKAHKEPRVVVSYLKPNMTIQLVEHYASYPKSQIPPHVGPFLRYDETGGQYYPVVHFNDFWLLRDKLVAANSTLDSLEMHFELSTVTTWWWALMSQMDKSFEQQTTMGLSQEGESDEIKRIFIEGNPYFLALTMAVSMLHSVFDFLAFKNDIGFWKNNRSMEGLSARSVLINAVCQLIILLYLFDNETSFVVLLSSCIGTAIEFWKVTKAFDVSIDKTKFPYIKIKDRASYSTNSTNKHDADAIKILSYVLFPLVVGYTIYTLMYKTHKSWYSWIVSSLVGAVYMFGFILMCPQLYLNYKLKSVAHLPWRQMTYKFLNTIIDDLFAFVIKMPTLHRLAVFRDDLVFLLQLYQRWIYPVDKTRVNEFGFAAEEPQAAVEGAAAEAAGAAATPALEGPAGGDAKPSTAEAASAAGVRKRGGKGAAAASAKAEPEERAFDSDDADAGRAGQKKGK